MHNVILILTVPGRANKVTSVQELLETLGDLDLLFDDTVPREYTREHDKIGWYGCIDWQKHFTHLKHLQLIFRVSACFSVGFKEVLRHIERRGVCHLRVEELEVCVEHQQNGLCRVDCAGVMERMLGNMEVGSPVPVVA